MNDNEIKSNKTGIWSQLPLVIKIILVIAACLMLFAILWGLPGLFSKKPVPAYWVATDKDCNAYYMVSGGGSIWSYYYFDAASGKNTRLKTYVNVTDTSSGLYLINGTNGEILSVSGTATELIAKTKSLIPSGTSLDYKDLYKGYLYCLKNSMQLYREDLSSGDQEVLIDIPKAEPRYQEHIHVPDKCIWDNVLFYYHTGWDDEKVCLFVDCIDLDTLKSRSVAVIEADDGHDFTGGFRVVMKEGSFVVYTGFGTHVIDCRTGDMKTLPEGSYHFDIYDGKIWYQKYDKDSMDYDLYTADMYTGETALVRKGHPEFPKGTVSEYTEFDVCEKGYYFNVFSGEYMGLYFYDFSSNETVTVYK